jgi:dienelactone hydrolase
MVHRAVSGRILFVLITLVPPSPAPVAGTEAMFDLSSPAGGPFPTDRFTLPDDSQNTGLRVNLPLSQDCTERPSDCGDVNTLNTLDGFNLQPRLSIPFSGPIDVASVTRDTVFLLDPAGRRIGIDQVVWDVETNTLHVESDELLDQHTSYILIVTREVRDAMNEPVAAAGAFQAFRHGQKIGHSNDDPAATAYRQALLAGLERAAAAGVDLNKIAVASVFTTQSITAILEKIRDQIKAATPEPADFGLGPAGRRTVFSVSSITNLNIRRHFRTNPDVFGAGGNLLPVLNFARQNPPGAVGQLAFGKYRSPDYLTPCTAPTPEAPCDRFIRPVGTRTGSPEVQGSEQISFILFLPSGPRPPSGWPVVLVGSGNGTEKETDAFRLARTMAEHGVAVMAVNGVGLGFGPLTTLTVTAGGESFTFPAGGRSFDQNGDGVFGSGAFPTSEGTETLSQGRFIGRRDALRQTVVDYMQLARIIEVGVDVDGDGVADLDPSRIYYSGFSHGADHGTILAAIEPLVRAAVLIAPGGGIESFRLAPLGNRPAVGRYLARRQPSLLNTPGIDNLGGIPVDSAPSFTFNENVPLRNGLALPVRLTDGISHAIQSPVINTAPGAMEIQRVLDYTEWAVQTNASNAYAAYLRKLPLAGNPAKHVIVQIARGDQVIPNPANTALVRAGDLADRTTFFRNDLAFAANPATTLTKNPHTFVIRAGFTDPHQTAIFLQAHQQIARFFASDGSETIDPDGPPDGPCVVAAPGLPGCILFEVPIVGALPEDLGFIP